MIWDAFLFSNEFDCLDMRLHELEGVIDRHLLIESTITFQGNPKPARFKERKADYSDWPIDSYAIGMNGGTDAWSRETAQRNAMLHGLLELGADDEDWVLTSDADEIPSGAVLRELDELPWSHLSFEQGLYFYFVNNRCTSMAWHGTQLTSLAELKDLTPQGARDVRNSVPTVGGGWHFCNLGDVDFMIEKLESFSHVELNEPQYKDRDFLTKLIAERRVIDGRTDMTFELDEGGLPAWVLAERKAHLFA